MSKLVANGLKSIRLSCAAHDSPPCDERRGSCSHINRESALAYPLRLLLVDLGLLLQLLLLPPGVLQLMLEEGELLQQRGDPPRLGPGLLLRSDQVPDLAALLLSFRAQGLLHDVQPLTELSVFLMLQGGGRTHTCRACDTTTPSGPVISPITVIMISGRKNTHLTPSSQDGGGAPNSPARLSCVAAARSYSPCPR